MNTSNKEERRKHLFKIAHRLRHGEALGEVEAVNILEDLITKHEVEARKESEELASLTLK